jgi:hypothetical protein
MYKVVVPIEFEYTDLNPGSEPSDWSFQVDVTLTCDSMDDRFDAHNELGSLAVYGHESVPDEDTIRVDDVEVCFSCWIDQDGGDHDSKRDVPLSDEELIRLCYEQSKGKLDWEAI